MPLFTDLRRHEDELFEVKLSRTFCPVNHHAVHLNENTVQIMWTELAGSELARFHRQLH